MTNPFLGRLNTIFRGQGIPTFPSILLDGNTVGWYDYKKLVAKDGSDFVSIWGDQSGLSHDLLQATGTNQPKWFSVNGILFDGIDNFMKTAAFTLIQPEMIYMVVKQITWTLADKIFDGLTNSSGVLFQSTSSPNIQTFGGSLSALQSNLTLNTYKIVRVLFNGANSNLKINEITNGVEDFGASNMGGFTLGARGDDTQFGHIEVKEIILRKVADGATDEQNIYDYLSNKYGI